MDEKQWIAAQINEVIDNTVKARKKAYDAYEDERAIEHMDGVILGLRKALKIVNSASQISARIQKDADQ